jgi:integrase
MQKPITTPTARKKLKPSGKPYFVPLERGVALGYRRLDDGRPGPWVLRKYDRDSDTYTVANLRASNGQTILADDYESANGTTIMSFSMALDAARKTKNGTAGPYTVADAVEAHLKLLENEGRDVRSVASTRYRISKHIMDVLGKRTVDSLTSDDYRDWRDSLVGKSTSGDALRKRRSSADRVWTIFRSALNQAFREGKVTSDQAWRRVKPYKGTAVARVRYLELDEARRLIEACTDDFRPLVKAALATGCRYGELTRIEAKDFDRKSGTIHIRQSKSGKGRHVVLNDEGRQLFEELCQDRIGLMFPDWKPNDQYDRMTAACRKAGITRCGFHTLRHTWASWAVMNGAPLIVVAKNLGHSTTRMVEAHYGHLSKDFIADEIRRAAPSFGF